MQMYWRQIKTTRVFFGVRFIFALLVSLLYILIAAYIQYLFVNMFGESTFNYIVGGGLSLFLGVLFCKYIGVLIFMFVKGWHVGALAYCDEIEKKNLSALDVGMRAFRKNLVSFGAVYAVRCVVNTILPNCRKKLWDLLDDSRFSFVTNFADSPVVRYLAKDILHYSFDATIFYIVAYPPDDLNDVPSTVITAVKKYLYCLPSIMLSSVTSYIAFRVIPAIIKWVFILTIFFTQGIVAGILISVLMYPLFYILDNVLFDPLTMIVFLSAYVSKCENEEEVDEKIAKVVDDIFNEENIDEPKETSASKIRRARKKGSSSDKGIPTRIDDESELFGESNSTHQTNEDSEQEDTAPSSINTPMKNTINTAEEKTFSHTARKANDASALMRNINSIKSSADFQPEITRELPFADVDMFEESSDMQDSGGSAFDAIRNFSEADLTSDD